MAPYIFDEVAYKPPTTTAGGHQFSASQIPALRSHQDFSTWETQLQIYLKCLKLKEFIIKNIVPAINAIEEERE
jgi:hypothetical protein